MGFGGLSPGTAVDAANGRAVQHTRTATQALQVPASGDKVPVQHLPHASRSLATSAKAMPQATSMRPLAAEADQASGAEGPAAMVTTGAAAQHVCCVTSSKLRPADRSSGGVQQARPGALLISQSDPDPEGTAAEPGQDRALPCTPGTVGEGQLQEQPCTPGLVSSSSACCVLPISCSSSGEESGRCVLEAENSIRFRKRTKFEALKARRAEARQKAEVLNMLR